MINRSVFFKVILVLCIALTLVGCATTNVASNDFAIYETSERMFWVIEGTAKNGEPSVVYILGTIHLGDERLFPLSNSVVRALSVSDRVVGELSSKDLNKAESELQKVLFRGIDYGSNVYDYFTDEQVAFLENNFDQEVLDGLSVFEPWVISTLVLELALSNTNLSAEYGLDSNIYAFATDADIEVEGLDSLKTQMDVLSYADFTLEEQIEIVKDILDDSISNDTSKSLNDMYRAYLNDDKDALAEIMNEPIGGSDLEQRYLKLLLEDRNKDWANKIIGYLNEGGETFIFAGAGHFLGENSVFDFLLD